MMFEAEFSSHLNRKCAIVKVSRSKVNTFAGSIDMLISIESEVVCEIEHGRDGNCGSVLIGPGQNIPTSDDYVEFTLTV